VIKLRVTDALGASAQGEFIFSVFDAAWGKQQLQATTRHLCAR